MFGFLARQADQQTTVKTGQRSSPDGPSDTHVPTDNEETPNEPPGAFSLWGVATAVSETFKKGGADLASSVRDTDWRAEINAFRQGFAQESEQLKVSTAAAVEELPKRATLAGTNLQQQLGGSEMQARLAKAGVDIEKFARKLVVNSRELVEDVKETILAEMGAKASIGSTSHPRAGGHGSQVGRLEAEIASMQRNSGTYCEEPPASAAYASWLKSFEVEEHSNEIDQIVEDNAFMSELQTRIVPLIVSRKMFWTRYFYRLHLLKEEDTARQDGTQSTSSQKETNLLSELTENRRDVAAPVVAPPSVEDAYHEAAAAAAGQHEKLELGRPGHAHHASRAATEADSDEHDVEGSAKSAGEGSGSDAWSVVSHPVQASMQSSAQAAGGSEQGPAGQPGPENQQAQHTPSPASSAAAASKTIPISETATHPAAGAAEIKADARPAAADKLPGVKEAAVPGEHEEDEELSELSDGEEPLLEAEEDWGTWE